MRLALRGMLTQTSTFARKIGAPRTPFHPACGTATGGSLSRSQQPRRLRETVNGTGVTLVPTFRDRIAHSTAVMAASGPHLPRQLFSVAPMMDWTDVHWRQFARLLTKHTWLWTEMVVDSTLIHQHPNNDRYLWFPEEQKPLVLQLGGSEPDNLRRAAELARPYGYTEVNLNCGCPSDRVAGAGCFGASLMLEPERVAACCAAMKEVIAPPCSACRRLAAVVPTPN